MKSLNEVSLSYDGILSWGGKPMVGYQLIRIFLYDKAPVFSDIRNFTLYKVVMV